MKYEVIEAGGEWVVRHRGCEVGRFEAQRLALQHISQRLKEGEPAGVASLALKFAARTAPDEVR
ncbi:hypothetical protein [Phenylobacterium deserti]|uniref:DUF2188 domain-containing protein n=1 Tax=Phenylobacterium deserti TaxID=1914756 RepID=A0A328APZ7_9CAUL|nr:hypothetical protein [Phenylobacterium deserti]RAK56667.1 hypothetical protein DJ018_01420 [Phenylobacterium deserti]